MDCLNQWDNEQCTRDAFHEGAHSFDDRTINMQVRGLTATESDIILDKLADLDNDGYFPTGAAISTVRGC